MNIINKAVDEVRRAEVIEDSPKESYLKEIPLGRDLWKGIGNITKDKVYMVK